MGPKSPFTYGVKRSSRAMRTMEVALGLISLFLVIHNVDAHMFQVGGSGDWSVESCSSYVQWAQKSRFQVGDTVLFSYKANQDSVVQVSEADYNNCSTHAPIAKYSDGHTMITLNQSGPLYFISGVVDHCKNHEKVMIIVLADRSSHSPHTPSPSPSAAPPQSLPPAPSSEEFPSPPPAPSTPETDHHTPAPAPSDDNHPPPTPSGASSFVVNFFCSVGTFVGFSLLV
ncbi:early nodulin-like protein 1 [Tanacetum coccineum]